MNMCDKAMQRIDSNALKVWRLTGGIASLVIGLCVVGSLILVVRFQWLQWSWLLSVLAILIEVILIILFVAVIPSIRWRIWRYAVNEREIDLKYGVFVVSRTLIPMARVQHVDTEQGPLLRHYNLATVTISTAAGSHDIPALPFEEAYELRNKIVRLAGIADDV